MNQPAPNLNPTQAVALTPGVSPPRVGALTAEKTRGTDLVSFRVPLSMKAVAQKIAADPRFGFNGTMSHLYLQALGYLLLQFEPYFRGDREVESWAGQIRELDRRLALEEPLQEFRDRLDRAEEKAEVAVAAKSLDYGFNVLRAAVDFVLGCEEPLRSATGERLRGSKPMQALLRALLDDEYYGLHDGVDRLQKFMGGAL